MFERAASVSVTKQSLNDNVFSNRANLPYSPLYWSAFPFNIYMQLWFYQLRPLISKKFLASFLLTMTMEGSHFGSQDIFGV